jgi:UDP-N-acetylmuramoylalanine--D-glutamate ligase
MTLDELGGKTILILGFGTEGQATFEFLRRRWPSKPLTIADQRGLGQFPEEIARRLQADPALSLRFGPDYFASLDRTTCEVIVKTPGIPASAPALAKARAAGCAITSHSQIFLSNYSRKKVIGVTGTKGKSTTTSLIHRMLTRGGLPAELVGNIGRPPLAMLDAVSPDTYFVHEFSSHQLAEIETSPHIAVLLNIFPEHLDYYSGFDEYVAAKERITRFQEHDDFLVFNADFPVPLAISDRTKAQRVPFSLTQRVMNGCRVTDETIVWTDAQGDSELLEIHDIPLTGRFNAQNVMAAAAAARLCGVDAEAIREAVRDFQALPHRLERVGTYRGITFYDDSIATAPEATLAALDALGGAVQTLLLGGHERNLDFSELGARLPETVKTVILFPPTGKRIWKAIEEHSKNAPPAEAVFVNSMEEAVRSAYARTDAGGICLLSPASPSFGIFKDYKERGESFKAFIRMFSNSGGI